MDWRTHLSQPQYGGPPPVEEPNPSYREIMALVEKLGKQNAELQAQQHPELQGALGEPAYGVADAVLDFVDPAHLRTILGKVGGKLAVKGMEEIGLPLALGQIAQKFGNLKNPGAFLYRSIGRPEEVDFLRKLMQREVQSEAPTTAIAPTSTAVFGGQYDPFGLVFSVKNPENIAHAGSRDLWSNKFHKWRYSTEQEADLARRLANALDRTIENKKTLQKASYSWSGLRPGENYLQAAERMEIEAPEIYNTYIAPFLEQADRYHEAAKKLARKEMNLRRDRGFMTNEWLPSRNLGTGPLENKALVDLGNEPLRQLFGHQAEAVRNLPPGEPRQWELINELIYKMGDPRELAGVRLPPPKSGEYENLRKPLLDLARDFNLPIWEFAPQTDKYTVAAGLEEFLKNPKKYRWFTGPEHDVIRTSADPQAIGQWDFLNGLSVPENARTSLEDLDPFPIVFNPPGTTLFGK